MKTSKYIIALALTLCFAVGNLYATITSAYYSSVDGKSGKTLFDAVHTVSKTGYKSVSYDGLWNVYCAIDINSSGKVWDMYSNATSYTCGGSAQGANYSKEGDSYNREHSIPKSWFGGSESSGTPGTDLFHVLPTDGYVNNMRSNYAFGEVSSATYTSKSGCKKGSPKAISISNSILNASGSSSQSCSSSPVFEPMDEYKGDFARGYFGTMIKWANGDYQTFTKGDGAAIFNTAYDASHYYGLTGYGVALLLKWHREDPVSQKEIDRNNGIQEKQGNRNPFIDYPELVEYIWGNKSDQTVTLSNLTPTFDGNYTTTVDDTPYTIILSRNGSLESVSGQTGTYNLPAKNAEDPACDNWAFDGWCATNVATATTTKPTYITSVSSASTIYAVYAKTVNSGNAPIRKAGAAVDDVMWSEYWTGVENNKTPTSPSDNGSSVYGSASVAYSWTDGNSTTQTYTSGGPNSNENILVSKGNGAFTASGIPTGGATELSVTYVTSGKGSISVSTSTANVSISGETITISNEKVTTFDLKFTNSASDNVRLDDIVVKVKTAGSGGGSTTTYASEPEECKCSGNLGTPAVTATPSDGTITLTWADVDGATNGYAVTISKGVGYTTECGDTEIGEVTHSGTTNTCVITGLVNGLSYTTSVVANATASTCESEADDDTTTPIGCSSWNVTFVYSTYSLTAGGATVTPTITGTTHGAVTYTSSNEAVLTVNGSGVVTPVGAGTATVTASWAGADGYCAKDIVSDLFTVTGSLTITYNANYGETPATETQTVTYNVAATLAANTFSRTGYTFVGWATEPNGDKVYDDQQASVVFTEATTLYAVWQINSHNVTFTPALTGATVTVNSNSTSPQRVNYGTTVTIDVTPAAHYSLNAITLSTGGEVAIDGNSGSFMMPDEDVIVTVTMTEDTKYTVNWYIVGTPTAETNYAGETLVGVNAPAIDCNGKEFVGWTATAAYNSDDAPADLFTDAGTKTMPSNNSTNYYAVFATATTTTGGGTSSVVDELTLATTGASGSTYSDWSDKAGTSGAVYAGQSAGGYESIQLRSNGSNSGIITTTSGGKATKVAVVWNSNTDNARTINVYGKNSAYSAATDLYGNNAGTLIGTISKSSGTELTISDDYEYIGIRSSSGALYLNKVSITWTTAGGGSTTTYSGYTTSCEAPEEVTITFNANYGEQPATTTQTIDYNTATTLTANAFTRTGYTFTGWNTQADGQGTTYADETEVTLTNNITLFAIWQINSHNVSYTITPSGKASVQVNNLAITPQSFDYGTSVTVAIAPDETYEITSVSATGITLEGSGDTRTFTMPDNDVAITITLTAKPTHTVTWSANGTTTMAIYYAGQEIVFPETAEGCEGKEFVGWSASTVALTDEAPEMITSATMGDNDLTYYAVFATVTTTNGGGTSSVVDELTLATTGASGSTYIAWSDKAGTSGAVYAGQSAGGNSSIQLRSNSSNSGIITTTSGGKATKVTIEWNNNTSDGRTLNVYGKSSAYEAASDLYGNNAGTLIGTIVCGTSAELTITDDYAYIGLRSASSAMYLDKVSITWTTTGGGSTTTYSGYTTSCAAPEEVTITFNANDGTQSPATTTQTIGYNTAATLTANAFTRTGYTFTGWNTQADGLGAAYSDKAEVTLTSNLTLYGQWSKNSYQVTFSTPAGATAVTVNSSSSSPQTVEFEATVTVAVTPDETHIVSGVSVSGDLAVTDNGDNTYSFTMPANNVTVTVTMETKPTYTIRFYDNGVMISEQAVVSGQTAAAPDDPEDCGDNTFAGWWKAELAASNTTGYSWIQDFTATQDQDYYAVYSRTEGGSGGTSSVVDVLTRETTGASGSTYLDWSGKTVTSDAVYAGQSAGDNESIQLRSKNNNSGVITTTSGGKATKVAVAWQESTTTGRVLNVYGKNAAYSAATDLYSSSTQGTLIGTIVCGTSTELNIADDYEYIGLRSNDGAMYLTSISITWSTSGGSTTYYTTAPDCTIPEVTTDVMLVTEVDGVTIAVKPVVSSNQAAAAPLLYVKGKYYRTSAISGAADITWQLVERKGTYYIKDASGNYLTVDGENLTLATEPFTWFTSEGRFVTQSGSGLCYSATERAFVVSSDASASIQQMAVISLEGEAQMYSREFTQVDYYATMCLPYAVAPPFIEGVTVYNVVGTNMKDGKIIGIVLAEETGILNAGQPYVILSTTAELNVWFAADMDMVDKAVETVGLVGNLSEEKLTVPVGCYGLKDNQLRRVVSGAPTVSQYKAYFDLSKVPNADTLPMSPSYKTMRTDADDVETAIDDLFGNPATINWNEPVYNVLGQRVGKDAVGVLIQNGMKFLIP